MSAFFRLFRVEQPFEGRPPGITLVVGVLRVHIHSHSALRAQTEAVLVAQRNTWQCKHYCVPQCRLEIEEISLESEEIRFLIT